MALVEVKVPDIGDFEEVAVIELLVKPGDTLKEEQSLVTVESDKASMEIPSSAAGVVQELKVKVGDKVNIGDLVAVLQGTGGAASSPPPQPSPQRGEAAAPAPAPAAERTPPTAALPPHEPSIPSGTLPHASPSVRKFARELGVPLEEVKGTGPKGRITQEDVQAFTKAVMTGEASTKASASGKGAGGGVARVANPQAVRPWPPVRPAGRRSVGLRTPDMRDRSRRAIKICSSWAALIWLTRATAVIHDGGRPGPCAPVHVSEFCNQYLARSNRDSPA